MMDRISCNECRQCNRKNRPSVTRLSKHCDTHHINLVKSKGGLFKFFTGMKDKIFEKRLDDSGQLKTAKGFRQSWFYR